MDLINAQDMTSALSTGSAGVFLLCFAAGLASSFTPCIYPLIPVTIGILGSRQTTSKFSAFLLTLAYVLGIAVTYAALGLVAAFTGSLFGSLSSNPWILLAVGTLIVGLALNMLDVYSIRFGSLGFLNGRLKSQGMLPNFLYGLAFGLVASPCTAPPLAVLLTWVGSTRSLVAGPLFLFAFALGMGSMLLVLGTFSSSLSRLPKSGAWMIHVKKVMGLMMVVMAGYFIFQAGRQW
jgi:thiol:disulfide interchange protein DsbD